MNTTRIPIYDPRPEINILWDELQEAIDRVIRSGNFILGPEVEAFEKEVAEYLGCKYAIGVNSGTDALVIALRALGIGEGDEVITTPFSFFATAESISMVGARPVFVDIDLRTFNISPALIEAAITPRTKAILPVHLYGLPAEMGEIIKIAQKYHLKVLEDCAQAFGASYQGKKVGTIGDAGAYSFFPTKNLSAFGDGGLIVTDNDQIAETARMLRAHGSRRKYYNEMLGYNSRLDALQAAILRVKLKKLDEWNKLRRQVAQRYNELLSQLSGVILPIEAPGAHHIYHQYTIRVIHGLRDKMMSCLSEAGIGCMIYYPLPLHLQKSFAELGYQLGDFPASEQAANEVMSIPMFPFLSEIMQDMVARAITDCMN